MKGADVINSAARLAGVVASGEPLSGTEQGDCLAILQGMIDTWQADGLLIFGQNFNEFPLVIGKQTYTLGAGGDFNMPRPAKIERMGVVILTSALPAEIPINMLDYNGWALIVQKLIQANYPLNCWDDGSFPLRNLNFWVIPNTACNVRLYTWQPITTWPDLNTTNVVLPPAYSEAVQYNLALRISLEFRTQLAPGVVELARDTLALIKEMNLGDPILTAELMYANTGGNGVYDWRTDQFVNQSRR